jgi:hypothetical protein
MLGSVFLLRAGSSVGGGLFEPFVRQQLEDEQRRGELIKPPK